MNLNLSALFSRSRRGTAEVSMEAIQALAILFIGIFIISTVSDITAINNTSSFYSTYTDLIAKTGTIYKVLILVLIVAALAVAVHVLRGFGGAGRGGGTGL